MTNKGDAINIHGNAQAGVIGSGRAQDFQQTQNVTRGVVADDLAKLLAAIKPMAASPDQQVDVAMVEKAKEAADKGDDATAKSYLQRVGGWVWEQATKIGVGVLTEWAKKSAGL